MKPLRTKDDILDYAAKNAPSAACARAIREGRGTIHSIRGIEPPHWILIVKSARGKEWKIKISCDETNRRYPVEYL